MAVYKWGREYWIDTAERVGTTALYGIATVITADLVGDVDQWWVIVGVPTSLSLIKCLLMNTRGDVPSASLVHVDSASAGAPPPPPAEGAAHA